MNNNELNRRTSNPETYRATTNLNIDMENPQINMNSAIGVNIKNIDQGNYNNSQDLNINPTNIYDTNNNFENTIDDNLNNFSTSSINNQENNFSDNIIPNTNQNYDTNYEKVIEKKEEKAIYEPTMQNKKKKDMNISIPIEVKVTFFIVFILIIFVLLMPYIYDFIKNLQLSLAG